MDVEEFAVPSPKRQRTTSPEDQHNEPTQKLADTNPEVAADDKDAEQKENKDVTTQSEIGLHEQNEILDALMQHVESEAAPPHSPPATHNPEKTSPGTETVADAGVLIQDHEIHEHKDSDKIDTAVDGVVKTATGISLTEEPLQGAVEEADTAIVQEERHVVGQELETLPELTQSEQTARQIDGIPPTEAIERVEGEGAPEWEADSSPYESSTDSDTTDSSSDDSDEDDEDADGDYAMLDPEEAARILMQGDAGSDDEGDNPKNRGQSSGLRTANEQFEDVPPIPEIEVTEDMKVEELGSVEAVVENNVLIRAKVSGEYQVLESGSLLCLQDRTLAGVVAETLGRVEEPLYTVRFKTEQEIKERGLSEKGTIVYYVTQHSSFVFTQPLKAFKGSDASNFHDEEVGDDEMEFSDDEAEAEHKRQLKLRRQGRAGDSGRGRGSGRGGRGGQRGGHKPSPLSMETNGAAYGNGSLEMNYDDVEEGEEGYTPLARPNNLHEMMSPTGPTDLSNLSHMPPPPFQERARGRGQHRGGRGSDRGGRGGRGNFRGNNRSPRIGPYPQSSPTQPQFPGQFANPFSQGQFPYSQSPSAPVLAPQNPTYPYSVITSPISPLPNAQFSFNAGFPSPQSYTSPTFPQQQWGQPMPGGFAPQFSNPAMMQFAQQFQQNQQQQQHQQQQSNGWQVNQAAAAEVQRQLEEMRRAQGGGH